MLLLKDLASAAGLIVFMVAAFVLASGAHHVVRALGW